MTRLTGSSLSPRARLLRLGLLSGSLSPVIGAYVYNQGYRLTWLGCPIRHFTGIPCPTCGMTHSFMAWIRGDWEASISAHLFGPILFSGFVMVALHWGIEGVTGHKRPFPHQNWLSRQSVLLTFSLIYLGYYVFRLYGWGISGELALAFSQSPLGYWILTGQR